MDAAPRFRSLAELEAALDQIRAAPRREGTLDLIVRRPQVGTREVLAEAQLDLEAGLLGDTWAQRGSGRMAVGTAHPDMQLNVMSARVIALLAPDPTRRPLAGDQLYHALDLSAQNLPTGTRLAIGASGDPGAAEILVTDIPHTGCKKFNERFGTDALRFVNSPVGRELRLRGLCARVVRPGRIRTGDVVRKV